MSNDKVGCKKGDSGFEERACIFCEFKEPSDCFWFREKHGAKIIYRNKNVENEIGEKELKNIARR